MARPGQAYLARADPSAPCAPVFLQIHYTFNKVLMLQEPLLVVAAFYILFFTVIIYVRLDFSITKVPRGLRSGAPASLRTHTCCQPAAVGSQSGVVRGRGQQALGSLALGFSGGPRRSLKGREGRGRTSADGSACGQQGRGCGRVRADVSLGGCGAARLFSGWGRCRRGSPAMQTGTV